jgi:hypothetical protein
VVTNWSAHWQISLPPLLGWHSCPNVGGVFPASNQTCTSVGPLTAATPVSKPSSRSLA